MAGDRCRCRVGAAGGGGRRIACLRWPLRHPEHPARYVAGALPQLPFADRSFDVVLSSSFLFTYAGRLSPRFHVDAALDLLRVAATEVRIYPVVGFQDGADEALDAVLGRLTALPVEAELVAVGYRFQRGADRMLRITRRGPGTDGVPRRRD